jgi:hypothetical protein
LTTFVDLLTAATLIFGLAYAGVELRQFRASRDRENALELLRSFQTPEFARALRAVYALPTGLTKGEIEEALGEQMDLVYALTTTWESLGILVHRGTMSLGLVDDFFSGPIRISWAKLRPYVEGERAEQGRDTIGEWFQWLAERMQERESVVPPVPAHILYTDWKAGHGRR